MKLSTKCAPVGAALALALAPAALAAKSSPAVSVRIEGKAKTLLPTTVVHPGTGSITKHHAPKGACPADSAQGALDRATHGRWTGPWSKAYREYLITSVLGEKYGAAAKYFWEIFAGNRAATAGACEIKARPGQKLLFAAVPLADVAAYPLTIAGAPATATVGHPFTVTVEAYDAKGKPHPLAGASVTGAGVSAATTDATGQATVTATTAGPLVLTADHGSTKKGKESFGYVRAETGSISVAG